MGTQRRVAFHVSDEEFAGRRKACEACGKEMLFYRHPRTQKWMTLDVATATPELGGGYSLDSHFATCSKPGAFRRPKVGEPKRRRG